MRRMHQSPLLGPSHRIIKSRPCSKTIPVPVARTLWMCTFYHARLRSRSPSVFLMASLVQTQRGGTVYRTAAL